MIDGGYAALVYPICFYLDLDLILDSRFALHIGVALL